MGKNSRLLSLRNWIIGSLISSVLPIVVAVFRWQSDDREMEFHEYIPHIDCLLLLFALALNCFVLTMEVDGRRKNKVIVFITQAISMISFILSGLYYMFISGANKERFNSKILSLIFIFTIINLLIGSIYNVCRYVEGQNVITDHSGTKEAYEQKADNKKEA